MMRGLREPPSDDEEEEDAWLALEVAKLEADEAATPRDADAYRPQLMDAPAMHALRRELHTSEARVQRDGHLREFVPHKPAPSIRPHTQPRGRRPLLHSSRLGRPLASNNHNARDGETQEADPFLIHDGIKREYTAALHDEVEQLTELADQYDATKQALLAHVDMVCSTKPTERTTSHEMYEKLDALLALAAKCTLSKAT